MDAPEWTPWCVTMQELPGIEEIDRAQFLGGDHFTAVDTARRQALSGGYCRHMASQRLSGSRLRNLSRCSALLPIIPYRKIRKPLPTDNTQ